MKCVKIVSFTSKVRTALALCGAMAVGLCGAETLSLTDNATWTDLSPLDGYDGVSIASGKTLTLSPESGVTLNFTKPISGAGGVTKYGAGNLELRGNNSFDGTFTIGGTGSVYAYTDTAFGSIKGRTTHYSKLYTGGEMSAANGAHLYLCGITTAEGFDLIGGDGYGYFYALANTSNEISGGMTVRGSQVDVYAQSGSTLTLKGGVTVYAGSSLRPSTEAGATLAIATLPLTGGLWNSKSATGTFILSAPGNACGYTWHPITLGCDWALDGATVNWDTGGTNMKIDLNGYSNRVSTLSCAKEGMNGYVTSTRGKAFLFYNGSSTVVTHLPFIGQAGLFHEGTGTTTLSNSTVRASDTTGELCVTNGTVVFAKNHSWPHVSAVTLCEEGRLRLVEAGQINPDVHLELSGSSQLELPENAGMTVSFLTVDGVEKPAGTYAASELGGHVSGSGATVTVTHKEYVHLVGNAVWGDAELAAFASSAYAGVRIIAGEKLVMSNTAAYTLSKTVAGAGTLEIDGSGQFNMNAGNPDFDGEIEFRGFSAAGEKNYRYCYVNHAQALGSAAGGSKVYLTHRSGSVNTGTFVQLASMTTDEDFTIYRAAAGGGRFGSQKNATVTFNGDVQVSGSQVTVLADQYSRCIFNKSFSGIEAALSASYAAELIFNCPCTATLMNSHDYSGTIVFNSTGNTPTGYFACTARFGVDYAFDNVNARLGMYYYANGNLDLNGHDQRVTGISDYQSIRDISRCSYINDKTGKKSFLHVNQSADGDSRVYFKGSAGLYWESGATVTFKETVSLSHGDLVVAAGKVVFDTAKWIGGSTATVKNGAVLELKNADNFAFADIVIEDGGKLVLPESATLHVKKLTLGTTAYDDGDSVDQSAASSYITGSSARVTCDGAFPSDYIITVSGSNAGTVVTNTLDNAGCMRIVKRGAGTAYVKTGASINPATEIVVEEGVLGVAEAADIPALMAAGTTTSIIVKDGGTFELGCMDDANAGAILRGALFDIAGEGALSTDGTTRLGAIRRVKRSGSESSANSINMLGAIVFSDDATISVNGLDMGCDSQYTKYLNGHALTKDGANQLYWRGLTTAGDIVVKKGNFILYQNPVFEATDANTIRVKNGGKLMFNECTSAILPVPHKLIYEDGSEFSIYNKFGKWGGPWKFEHDVTFTTNMKSPDNGTLTMTNAVDSRNHCLALGSTHPDVVLSGPVHHDVGGVSIAGKLEVRDGAEFEMHQFDTEANTEFGLGQSLSNAEWGYPAELVVSNATVTSPQAETAPANAYGQFVLSWTKGYGSLLNIQRGAAVTGALVCANGGLGAVHQSGGTFVAKDTSGKGTAVRLGYNDSAYGAYVMRDGYFATPQAWNSAVYAGCTSILRQDGGYFATLGGESISAQSGYLSICQTGGCFTNAGAISFGHYTASNGKASGGRYEIAITGRNTLHYDDWDTRIGGSHTYVNSTYFYLADGATYDFRTFNYQRPSGAEDRRLYFGLDGGVMLPHLNGNVFVALAPDRTTVYGGGLVFDTSKVANGSTFNAAIKKPTGKVVTSIALPESAEFLAEKNFLGPAKIVISGGSGAGATAVTEYDETTRTLTGVRVLSPGFGYQEGDAVTATLEGPCKTNTYACAVTLGDPDLTGGLVKRGSHSLIMSGANDYRGKTRIEGGSLQFLTGSFPSGSEVEISAEAANEARQTGTPALIVTDFPTGGKITLTGAENVNLADLQKVIRLASFRGTAPGSVSLKAVDSDGEDYSFPGIDSLYFAGTSICLGHPSGTAIIFR